MAYNYIRKRIDVELIRLNSRFETRKYIRGAKDYWEGEFKSTILEKIYKVRIYLNKNGTDIGYIKVITPLERYEEEELPHVFNDKEQIICLYMMGERKEKDILTVVPWIAEWLYFYEIWSLTGIWTGGGHGEGEVK